MLTVQGLPVGTYEAVLETVDEAPDAEQAQQAKPRRSVSVRRGGRPTRTIFNIRAQQRQRGDLLIRVRDQDGSYLEGACFGLIPNGETAPSAEVCDNRGDDENSADGRILLASIRAGRYTLTRRPLPPVTRQPRISRSASRRAPCARSRSPTRPNRSAPQTSTSRRLTARGTRCPGLLRDHAREFDPRSLRR